MGVSCTFPCPLVVARIEFVWSRAVTDRLVSGGRDAQVKLWRLGEGEPLATFAGHSLTVSAVDFAPGAYFHCLLVFCVCEGLRTVFLRAAFVPQMACVCARAPETPVCGFGM